MKHPVPRRSYPSAPRTFRISHKHENSFRKWPSCGTQYATTSGANSFHRNRGVDNCDGGDLDTAACTSGCQPTTTAMRIEVTQPGRARAALSNPTLNCSATWPTLPRSTSKYDAKPRHTAVSMNPRPFIRIGGDLRARQSPTSRTMKPRSRRITGCISAMSGIVRARLPFVPCSATSCASAHVRSETPTSNRAKLQIAERVAAPGVRHPGGIFHGIDREDHPAAQTGRELTLVSGPCAPEGAVAWIGLDRQQLIRFPGRQYWTHRPDSAPPGRNSAVPAGLPCGRRRAVALLEQPPVHPLLAGGQPQPVQGHRG